jgi:elongation factor 3
MSPAIDTQKASAAQAENQKSIKIVEELLAKLSVSQSQDEINATAHDLASFVNGEIEQGDVPTKYDLFPFSLYRLPTLTTTIADFSTP